MQNVGGTTKHAFVPLGRGFFDLKNIMPYRRSNPPHRRPPESSGCAGLIIRLTAALIVLAALYILVARPQVGTLVGQAVADQLAPPAAAPAAELPAAAENALPALVAALPLGEIALTASDANALLSAQAAALGPVDSLELRFSAGQASADVSAYGLDGVVSANLGAADGKLVLHDARIDGTLGLLIGGDELAGVLTDRINAELTRQGRTVEDLRIEEGRVVLVTR